MIKTLMWSLLLYRSELWTQKKEDIRRLESVEIWFLEENGEDKLEGKSDK